MLQQLGVKNPYFNCHTDVSRDTIGIDGQSYINYSGYNYLGLSGDPELKAAVIDAVERYGTSVSASRIVSGEIPLHRELEAELAAFHGVDDAVVFVSGYGTNVSTIGHLFGPRDLLLHDSLIHNSALTGCILSGARRMPFPHNDYDALERLLREHRTKHERVCVLTEGVFSMDGDIPDLQTPDRDQGQIQGAAHGGRGAFGGNDRRDRPRHCRVLRRRSQRGVDIWMGTLSKSFASCGGYIAGCQALTLNLRYAAPGGVLYSVGHVAGERRGGARCAAQAAAVDRTACGRWASNSRLFVSLAKAEGLDTGPSARFAGRPGDRQQLGCIA